MIGTALAVWLAVSLAGALGFGAWVRRGRQP